jgi:diguanylate cyclase (GGDEF)-like protein/PAS domain S-box-containing protein
VTDQNRSTSYGSGHPDAPFALISRSIFDTTRDGVIITDADNCIVDVNPAFSNSTGYSRDEVIGKTPAILKSGRHDAAFFEAMWQAIDSQGHWQGEIWDRRKNGEVYLEFLTINVIKDQDGRILRHVAVFTDIHQLREALAKMDQLAHFDGLTELPNRGLFAKRLEQAIDTARQGNQLLALALLDMDGFKATNDRHGRVVGDQLLLQIAQRLKQVTRTGDTLARLGGDEFGLFLTGLANMEALERTIARILALCSAPYQVGEHTLHLSASLGVTLFPLDSADAEALLRHADQAMYQAKQAGGNGYHLFDAPRDQAVQSRRQLIERLGQAIVNDELELFYQPKVNLRSGQVIGLEALLRWRHPELGLLLPDDFLPHAEHSDIIDQLGEHVMRMALAQATAWQTLGLRTSLSVNIGARQLQHPDFLDVLRLCLADFPDLPPGTLELEILESAAIGNTQHVRNLIEACRDLGIRFALDDFGTGYASLTYLREIPADVLKIDQSFIHDILDSADALTLVEGAIGLATAFRRIIVAEGVENAEQGVLLMRLGCDIAQGNGIAPAMPASQIPAWITSYRPDPQWVLWADTRWEMSDFPLLVAQYDHLKWVKRLMLYVEGASLTLTEAELSDHHSCRFGHWYYGHGTIRYGHLPEFKALEPIHQDVHRLGPDIVKLRTDQGTGPARQRFRDLLILKDEILVHLTALQHAVADRSCPHDAHHGAH